MELNRRLSNVTLFELVLGLGGMCSKVRAGCIVSRAVAVVGQEAILGRVEFPQASRTNHPHLSEKLHGRKDLPYTERRERGVVYEHTHTPTLMKRKERVCTVAHRFVPCDFCFPHLTSQNEQTVMVAARMSSHCADGQSV